MERRKLHPGESHKKESELWVCEQREAPHDEGYFYEQHITVSSNTVFEPLVVCIMERVSNVAKNRAG